MDPIIQAEIKKNFKFNFTTNLIDGTFFWLGSSFFATRTIAPLFLSYLTEDTFIFGVFATIVSTGWLLPQLFTASWVQRSPLKKYFPVNVGFFTERLPILLLPLAAWVTLRSEALAATLFVFLIGWHVIGAGVVAVGWQDMLAKIFPVEWRGRFFGITNFAGNATGILGASAAAWMLESFPFPYNFMYAFGTGGLFILLSWIFLALTREPKTSPKQPAEDQPSYWRSLVPILRTDINYRRYLLSQVVTSIGSMAIGFFTIYALRQWQVSDGMVSLFTTSLMVGTAISNLLFGWLGDKYGHKFIMEISTLAFVLALGIAILAPAPEYFFLVFALQGANNAGFILSGISIVFEFCEEDVRPTYIGLTNSVIGIFAGLSPLIGGFLAENTGFLWVFAISLIFSLAGLVMLHYTVREPRIKPTLDS